MYYNSFLYLIFYFFNYLLTEKLSEEQKTLKKITGERFSKKEAWNLWSKINDHKWYISEKLGRDSGFNVAALDYFENLEASENKRDKFKKIRSSDLQTYANLSSFV